MIPAAISVRTFVPRFLRLKTLSNPMIYSPKMVSTASDAVLSAASLLTVAPLMKAVPPIYKPGTGL